MADKSQESRERGECRYEPRHESIVCAVMFAIVTSILGSAMFSLVQGTDKKVIKQEVYKSSINCNCHESAHSHFVQRIVQCEEQGEEQESSYPAFLRALALLLFCAGYFGDEWRNVTQDRADRNREVDVKRENQDFPLEFLGWLFFTLQACMVNNLSLYVPLGVGAICCVSLDLEKKKSRNADRCENQHVDDWLCENAIWMTWLLLSIALPFRAVILAGALLIVALLIFITKVSGWTEGRQYGRRALAALTIGFPLLLIITDCSFH